MLRLSARIAALRREEGQVLVLFALSLSVVVAATALVIDGARVRDARDHAQSAADRIALALAWDAAMGRSPAEIQADADLYAEANGLGTPLASCAGDATDPYCYQLQYTGDSAASPCRTSPYCVQVRIEENVDPSLAKAVGISVFAPLKATAAAMGVLRTGGDSAAIVFSASQECQPIQISGSNIVFDGAVVSNGGIANSGSNDGPGPLFYGSQYAADSGCVHIKSTAWSSVGPRAPTSWPVEPPTCLPDCSAANATAGVQITSVDGVPCTPIPGGTLNLRTNADVSPGNIYCASQKIAIQSASCSTGPCLDLHDVGFIAPVIVWSNSNDDRITAYTGIDSRYGGLLFYAYGAGNALQWSGSNKTFSGAIFVPNGGAQISGSKGQGTCTAGGQASSACTFIEAQTVQFPGSGATIHGTGPNLGGGADSGASSALVE